MRPCRVSPERVEEVAHHYEIFGGVSPITELTQRQADGLASRLVAAGYPLPVFAHLALVLLLGLYIPPYLAEWYRAAARMIGGG